MLLRLQNAVTSMNALVRQQERVANNLANANTVGYKRDRAFTEALDDHLDEQGAPRSERQTQHLASLEQGTLEKTGNPLDVALGSDGFFVLLDEATGNERYNRTWPRAIYLQTTALLETALFGSSFRMITR